MSPRRLTTSTGLARRSFWLLFGGIWLVVGLTMLIAGIGSALQERAWTTDALRTSGIVLVKELIPADSDSGTQYRVRFRFTTQAGEVVEGNREVDVSTWERLAERGSIEVHYLSSSPSSARLEPGPDPAGFLLFLVLGAVFGGVGGLLFFRAVAALLRARRLLRSGTRAEATVVAVEPTRVSFNRRPQFRVRYSYRDAAGASHEGDSGYLDWEEASRWSEGSRVEIRYDPRRPAESQWVGQAEPSTPAVDAPPPSPAVDAPPPR